MSNFIHVLSGEYLLHSRPNGGGVVLARSSLVSFMFYGVALIFKEVLTPGALFEFSQIAFKNAVGTTIPWFGAIFAATYASFYARYSSQWTYLANTYNQFMAVKASAQSQSIGVNTNKSLVNWQAGFVSDCFTLHLDRKPIFEGVIAELMKDPLLKQEILDNFSDDEREEFVRRHGA